MNQAELELEMAEGGRRKALARFAVNEEKGSAAANPYAQAVFRRFILPLADGLKTYLTSKERGVAAKNKVRLRDMDPLTLAFITVRGILNECMAEESMTLVHVAREVGKTVYGEHMLQTFEDMNPELYYTLVNDFERRMTKSERHRFAVFRDSARKDGKVLPIWHADDVCDVGLLLVGVACDIGLARIEVQKTFRKTVNHVVLSDDIRALTDQVKGFVAANMPITMPCVEPPRPWLTPNDGGYHTLAMRRVSPCIVRGAASVDDGDVPAHVLAGANLLQRVEWRINEKVLEIAQIAHERFDVGDSLVSDRREDSKPDKPLWLGEDMKFEDMADTQRAEFGEWRGAMREWYTQNKIRGSKSGATNESLFMANKFVGRPLWFLYTADFRGRFYASSRGVSPQGGDLAKALLEFGGEGWAIDDQEAEDWFRIAGTGRWAVNKIDKAPIEERIQWSKDNDEFICRIAADPISYREWTEADCPFQFLAWCFEYAEWRRDPQGFRTRLPLGQDGSCNGLQHFSAMLRDRVGGTATNLVPGNAQQDIYGLVAVRTEQIVADDPDDGIIAGKWRRHALSRALVKRSVMTLPYGSTRFASAEFILKEYVKKGQAPEFPMIEQAKAATWLSYRVWEGIGQVVIKAREAMTWLQESTSIITEDGPPILAWRSPSGFLVRQRYFKADILKLKSRAVSGKPIQLRVALDTEHGNAKHHISGVAPNFVHSCDAAHMHRFLEAAEAAGLTALALIHDDYGCPAPMVALLHKLLRETFVAMYTEHDPLAAFRDTFAEFELPPMPERGDLDLNAIRQSRYFFI